MSNILNTLAASHTPSLAQAITAQEYPGKWLYAAEGGSIAVIDTTDIATFEATRGVKKFQVGDRGVLPRRMVLDPDCATTPINGYRDTIYVAGGLDGLWAISADVNALSGNPAIRIDDRQDYNVDVQDNIRMCNDVKFITINGVVYLAALFQAKDDNRLRLYKQTDLRVAINDSKGSGGDGLETTHEVQAVVEVILGVHPSSPAIPATSLWGSIGLGMTVYGPDVYVAMGTNGIVKVSFSSAATPVATTTWGPIFGTGSVYQTNASKSPSHAPVTWYKNLVFSGHDGATTKEELPVFSDVAVDTAGGYLFAAMENLGWVSFDLADTWATDMVISHHEGELRDANEEPLLFRLRDSTSYSGITYVRSMVVKSSAASGDILAITGDQAHTFFDQFSRHPGITYDPVFDWNHSFANAPAGGETYTALYRIDDLVANTFNNVSLDRVGGGDVFLTKHDNDNIMNVYNFGEDNYPSDKNDRTFTTAYSAPMTINWDFYPDNPSTHVESTSTVENNANRYVRSIANHVRGNFTFEVDRSILDENALITGGNDGGDATKNDGFLVRGVVDGKEVIKAWDASALNSDPNVQTKLGIRTTDFAQWKKCGPPGARGQYAAGERFTHTSGGGTTGLPFEAFYGYWNFKSINVPQDPYNNEPFTLGDHAIMYPRNSFGVVSERPYYGAISRSSEYDDYLASQGKSPYLFMNATNSPEGLIMASRDSLLEALGKPYTDDLENADTFLVSNPNAYTAFITHPEVSGMPRNTDGGATEADVLNAKEFWQYKAGASQPPFFSWMPEVFPIMDSGTEKWIACVPCHNIINYPKLIADVARKAPLVGTANNPLVVLDPSWEAGDVFYRDNKDHGMAMFFDITDPTTLAKGNLTPILSPFPKILLPINSLSTLVGSAVWKAKHVVLGGITYIVVIDMMGSVYAYNAADIFTVTGPTLTATGSWDVPPSNFDKQSNNAFALDIDKVNSTDTSAYVYIGVKRMGIEVLRLNSDGTLVHEELIPCWDSPFGVKLHGTHPNRRMLVADKIGGIREFKTS